MSSIKVETTTDRPITAEMLADTRVLDCLEVRNAKWRYSLLSADRHSMICTFEAPEAESVRQAYRQADVGFIDTLRRKRTEILGSTSWLARWCHHQRVEVGLSPSVNSGVPRRIYFNSCLP